MVEKNRICKHPSDVEIKKSNGDENEYFFFTLPNKVRVLLIQDNNQKELSDCDAMAYASVVMTAGSFNDPPHRQGLAHFLEHMIFMGSEKYPEESSFSDFCTENGGYYNAYTNFEWTNYQFQVKYTGLQKAVDMFADVLQNPLLTADAMGREIEAVHSEFKMNYPDDSVRLVQVLQKTSNKDHIFNRFIWGNNDSLKGDNEETLNDDLRDFYKTQYSADRCSLVIQVKSKDNCQELRKWIEESFGRIENKNLGLQDFSRGSRDIPEGPLPYSGQENEIVVMDSFQDLNKLCLFWMVENDWDKFSKKSLELLDSMIGHQGKGSLTNCLKSLNYAASLETDVNTDIKTAFRMYSIEIDLTQTGVKNYRKVLAIVFEYLRLLTEEWLSKPELPQYLQEIQKIAWTNYQVYTVPDQEESTTSIADSMVYSTDVSEILKETYPELLIYEINRESLQAMAKELSYDSAKVIFTGNKLLESDIFSDLQVRKEQSKEEYFGSHYKLFEKPELDRTAISSQEKEMLSEPAPNQFMPENFNVIVSQKAQKSRNDVPQESKISDGLFLYHLLDHVYLKPITYLDILLRIKQPEQRYTSQFKSKCFLETPEDFALFNVLSDCLLSTVESKVGYEAQLANFSYEFESTEEMGVHMRFSGYSDKIFQFATTFIDIMTDCAEVDGFSDSQVDNSIEKAKTEYANANFDVSDQATNNRLLYLLPHTFHADLMLKVLNEELERREQGTSKSGSFCPGRLLREKILDQITQVQVLVCGNTTQAEAQNFCQKDIKSRFKINNGENKQNQFIEVGCIYTDSGAPENARPKLGFVQRRSTSDLNKSPSKKLSKKASGDIKNSPFKLPETMRQSILEYKEGMCGQQIWECLASAAQEEPDQADQEEEVSQIPDKIEEEEENDNKSSKSEDKPEPQAEPVEFQDDQSELDKQEEGQQEDGEEEDEYGEEDDENSVCEIYFQPKFQTSKNSFELRCKIEVLQSFIDEKMFEELRTKQQLGYKVFCLRKTLAGIQGISFVVQSAEYSPVQLETEILHFIDTFYQQYFDKEKFETYKQGVIDRKMNGFKSMNDESAKLFSMLSFFTHEHEAKISWDRMEQEIEMIKRECTFEKIKAFYQLLFAPQDAAFRRYQTVKERKESMEDSMIKYRQFYRQESNAVQGQMPLADFERMLSKSSSADLHDLKQQVSYRNEGQKDERNFISVRVFSKKFKDDISHFSLQQQALKGQLPLCPAVYKTYLPTVLPAMCATTLRPIKKGIKQGDSEDTPKKEVGVAGKTEAQCLPCCVLF